MPKYKLKIKTISPIHIGDGGVYDGMTLLEADRNLYPLKFVTLVKAFELHDISFEKFKEWVIDNKGFRFQRKPRINDFLETQYTQKCDAIINTLTSLNKIKLDNLCRSRPNTDIATCVKDVSFYPYIPGSTIKGAIVTAVMAYFLQNDTNFYKELITILDEYSPFLDEVYEALKKIKQLTKEKKETGHQNFRQIGISGKKEWSFRKILSMRERPINKIETELKSKFHLQPGELDRIINLIEEWRKTKADYNRAIWNERKKYDKKRINWISEKLKSLENSYWEKYLTPNRNDSPIGAKVMRLLKISDTNTSGKTKISPCMIIHQEPKITMNLYYEIIDTNSSFQAQFVLEPISEILDNLKFTENTRQVLTKDFLLQCIHKFSAKALEEDIQYFNKLKGNYRFDLQGVKLNLRELQSLNTPDSPLLRIGKGQGFLSLTLATLIKKYDQEHNTQIYPKLLGVVQSEKNNPDNYPITRRLITDGANQQKLPGWIKIRIEN